MKDNGEGDSASSDAVAERRYDPDTDPSLSATVIAALADATGVSATELPPLNGSVDLDALNGLFADDPEDHAGTVSVAFTVSDHLVTVTESGRVTVAEESAAATVDRRTASGIDIADADARARHDWARNETLSTTVVTAVVEAIGADPRRVRESMDDAIDTDALNALFAPRANGTRRSGGVSIPFRDRHVTARSDGTVTVESALARLKHAGGNLLVVGGVPDDVVDTASATLLGDAALDRACVFTLCERGVDTARTRLSMAGADAGGARIVDCRGTVRSATTADDAAEPSVTDTAVDVDDIEAGVVDAIDGIEYERGGLDPAELRFCFDSLRPLVDRYDADGVASVLAPVCTAVRRASGMGHYVLPVERDSAVVRAVEPLFDAVVELDTGDAGPEQRWHLRGTGHTTEWFGLPSRSAGAEDGG